MSLSKTYLRNFALLLILPVGAIGSASLSTSSFSTIVAHGPIQKGHAGIECVGCHTKGTGSVRQQIQANLSYALGHRVSGVNFGYQPVTSDQCSGCHERPNDRHPINRFNEPRFAEVRRQLEANSCLGCHSEHSDARVSVGATICSHCHEDLVLKNDPLDVAHTQLVIDEAWDTCLGCHDFHGNHSHTAQTKVNDAFDINVIQAYFEDGIDPYGIPKLYEAKSDD